MNPNIIVLIMDTTRARNCSCYGYNRPTTPNLNRIAEQGVLYENAIAPACWSLPSHTSLLTGLYPSKHGAHEKHKRYDKKYPLIQEILRKNGYETYGVSVNSWISREMGNTRGFDRYIKLWQLFQTDTDLAGISKAGDTFVERLQEVLHSLTDGNFIKNIVNGIYGRWLYKRFIGAEHINEHILRSIDKANKPFFVYAVYWETHLPYRPKPPFTDQFLKSSQRLSNLNRDPWRYITGDTHMDAEDFAILRDLYDASISYLDSQVGSLYQQLKERRLLDNTILIITSDHGDNIGEHGLMDHAYSLHDTLTHVPLIAQFPAGPTNVRISEQVQLIDILPTILAQLNYSDPSVWNELQGENIHPDQNEISRDRLAFSEYLAPHPSITSLQKRVDEVNRDLSRFDRRLDAVRTLDYKYIWGSDGNHELYDMRQDPWETHNLIAERSDVAQTMQYKLDAWRNTENPLAGQDDEVEHSEEVLRRLRGLGYIE